MQKKNFRVANLCGNCKHFFSMSGYGHSGKKKNGYCLLEADADVIPPSVGSWKDFVEMWNGTLDIAEFSRGGSGWMKEDEHKAWSERRYAELENVVDFWRRNHDKIHTCHRENTCDAFDRKTRGNHAARHVKNSDIDWLVELEG